MSQMTYGRPDGCPVLRCDIRRLLRQLQRRRIGRPTVPKPRRARMAVTTAKSAGGTVIRPFTIEIPEADLDDLRARIAASRLPEKETVADASQGVQLATIQELARYWSTDYDFRRVEARLNALPQFVTEIDGLDIHFIHVESRHEN